MDVELKRDMIAMGSHDGVPGPFLHSGSGGCATEACRSKFSIRQRDKSPIRQRDKSPTMDAELVREMIAMGSHEGKQGPLIPRDMMETGSHEGKNGRFIPLRSLTESAQASVALCNFSGQQTRHTNKTRHSVTRHVSRDTARRAGPGSQGLAKVAAAYKLSSPLPGRSNRRGSITRMSSGSIARTSSSGAIARTSSNGASTMRAVSGTLEEILAAAKKGGKKSIITTSCEPNVLALHDHVVVMHGAHGSDTSKNVETSQSYVPFEVQMESFEGHFVNLALPHDRAPRHPGAVERSLIL